MSSYSDIIFLAASLVIFSMLTINTARSYQTTSQNRYKADIEYRAITMAQDEIDKVQWIYDENELDPVNPSYIYSSYPKTETVTYGSSDQYSELFTINANSTLIENTSIQNRYRVTVTVSNTTFNPGVSATLTYIKTYGN